MDCCRAAARCSNQPSFCSPAATECLRHPVGSTANLDYSNGSCLSAARLLCSCRRPALGCYPSQSRPCEGSHHDFIYLSYNTPEVARCVSWDVSGRSDCYMWKKQGGLRNPLCFFHMFLPVSRCWYRFSLFVCFRFVISSCLTCLFEVKESPRVRWSSESEDSRRALVS